MSPNDGKTGVSKKGVSALALDKQLTALVPTRLESFLTRIAGDEKAWAAAKKNPEKYLEEHGFRMDKFRGIEFGENLKVPPLIPILPIKRCPRGFHAEIRWERESICLRWIWLPIWPPRPRPFPWLPPTIPLWIKICVKRVYIWIPHWVCVRDRIIFPPIKPPRIKPPRPVIRKKRPIG